MSTNKFLNYLKRISLAMTWVFFVILFFSYFFVPVDNKLDPSGQGLFSYYTKHGLQYGVEAIHVAGPYGLVNYWTYIGDLYYLRWIIGLFISLTAASLLLYFFSYAKKMPIVRVIWLLFTVIVMQRSHEIGIDFTILFAGLYLILNFNSENKEKESVNKWLKIFYKVWLSFFLGLFLLVKANLTIEVIFLLFLIGLWGIILREYLQTLLILGGSILVTLILWSLAGQNILNIIPYFKNIFLMSGSYNAANALLEANKIFFAGVFLLALILLGISYNLFIEYKNKKKILLSVLFVVITFFAWKHGFVRADSHVQIFFQYGIAIAFLFPIIFLRDEYIPSAKKNRAWIIISISVAILLSGIGGSLVENSPYSFRLQKSIFEIKGKLINNSRALFHPINAKIQIDQGLAANREKFSLPAIKNFVGDSSVDMFGFSQGVLFLNNFNYQPRPAAVAFEVHNDQSLTFNKEFLDQEENLPSYFIFNNSETIDGRLPTNDDLFSLEIILNKYHPVLFENGYFLLELNKNDTSLPQKELIQEIKASFQEKIEIPQIEKETSLYLAARIDLNFLGKIRSALYKAPLVTALIKFKDGKELRHRIVANNMKHGFLLDPLILYDQADLCEYYYVPTSSGVKSISFDVLDHNGEKYFTDDIDIKFYTEERMVYLDPIDACEVVSINN